jgi:hypothetical protein
MQMIAVLESTRIPEEASFPKDSELDERGEKLVPNKVTNCPPAFGPVLGCMDAIVIVGKYSNVSKVAIAACSAIKPMAYTPAAAAGGDRHLMSVDDITYDVVETWSPNTQCLQVSFENLAPIR